MSRLREVLDYAPAGSMDEAMKKALCYGEAKYDMGNAITDDTKGRAFLKSMTVHFKNFCKANNCSMNMQINYQTVTFTVGFPNG